MSDRMTELIDAAQKQQRENEERALANVRARMIPETDPDFDGKNCIECGNSIPPRRLDMQKIRCVGCQDAKERGSKLFRR